MIRVISGGILAGGIGLTAYGINASHAFGSEVTRFFTGNPSDHSMLMIIAGVVLIGAGLAGLFAGGKKG